MLLEAGTFKSSGVLRIGVSGVVLRGSGVGATSILFSGAPRDVIEITGGGTWSATGPRARITDDYVPSGARTFHVDDASSFAPGDTVLVDRPVTAAWIAYMGMDTLVRDGKPQTGLAPGTVIHSDRVATAVSGNTVTVDAPLSDSLDAAYVKPGATLTHYTFAGRIENVGLESLRLVAPKNSAPITIEPPMTARGCRLDAAPNAWVSDVTTDEFISGSWSKTAPNGSPSRT